MNMFFSYNIPQLSHGPHTPNIKTFAGSKKITLKTRDIEPPIPKMKLIIHLTKSPKCDNIYEMCLYLLEEHNCLILTY